MWKAKKQFICTFVRFLYAWGALLYQAEIIPIEPVRVMPERESICNETATSQAMMLHHRVRIQRLVLFFFFAFILSNVYSQNYILGRILDDNEVPYAFAHASLRGPDYFSEQICSELGVFRFEKLASGSYELLIVTPYGIRRRKIELRTSIDITLHVARNIKMDEISVVATKAGQSEPVTHDDLSAEDIKRLDFGRDMPFLLEQTPSVVATSDAGNGIGYSGLRIRGTDPTRINVTLNGIPVNDAESHNVFWVDLPDVASSLTNIQIQRGVGWSQPGAGDFGGSVKLNSLGFHPEPYLGLKFGVGSFNTSRTTIAGGTGLLKGRFTLDQRLSFLRSDGYIDRATSNLSAVSVTAGYHHDATNIRFQLNAGNELTYQSWNGVPAQYIDDPVLRTFNTAGNEKDSIPHDNEVDDYGQTHYQLHVDQAITPFARWTGALHYTRGKGFFEQYKADQHLADYGIQDSLPDSDLIRRRWLDNHFYGFTSVLHFGRPEHRYFLLGGGWNRYEGRHFGIVHDTEAEIDIDDLPPYYDNDADKKDWNLFARSNMKIAPNFDITVDLQRRWIRYSFQGPDQNGLLTYQNVKHAFFNPKLGALLQLGQNLSLYALTGLNHKEPNRDDYVESTPLSRPRAERLWDNELGLRKKGKNWSAELTGYYMQYKDQLVPTGRLNDVGAYTRVNVDESHRLGLEFSFAANPKAGRFTLSGHATLSQNRIASFDEYIDDWDTFEQQIVSHQNTDIAFSPTLLAGATIQYTPLKNAKRQLHFALNGRHVGEQYVDNTSRTASLLDHYTVADLIARFTLYPNTFKEISFAISVNNVFDAMYESNGWIYRFNSANYDPRADDPYSALEGGSLYHLKGFFPQAGRNVMIQFGLNF